MINKASNDRRSVVLRVLIAFTILASVGVVLTTSSAISRRPVAFAASQATCAPSSTTVTAGVVNTAWPLVQDAAAGTSQITISNTASEVVGRFAYPQAGDLVLIMQLADATINTTNTSAYGAGTTTGSGYTALGNSGLYEYARVTDYTPATGVLTLATATTKAYKTTAISRAQVVLVPEYTNLTLTGNLTAPPLKVMPGTDRVAGGVVAIRVTGTLNLNTRNIIADGLGSPGGASVRETASSIPGNTIEWVTTTSAPTPTASGGSNASKGVGVAGTTAALQSLRGGQYGQGGPANGGGGGGDTDGAGGGGGNGGAGGMGSLPFYGTSRALGGSAIAVPTGETLGQRIFMGGGGGGGTGNGTTQTAGGPGGGIAFVQAGTLSGTGRIGANGAAGPNSSGDAAGGSGAGGTVAVWLDSGTVPTGVQLTANGGASGGGQEQSGPGGGGRIITNVTNSGTASVAAGTLLAGASAAGAGLIAVDANRQTINTAVSTDVSCDFGDAPDTAVGTSTGNYQTNATDGYAAHVPTGVTLGATRTGESAALQNIAATGDADDGMISASLSPVAAPSVTINLTGVIASQPVCVVGFLDRDNDGDFANADERATTLTGITTNGQQTLVFPSGTALTLGTSRMVRVRATSDTSFCSATLNPPAAANGFRSVGWAADGEIEDWLLPVATPVDVKVTKELLVPASGPLVPGGPVSWKVRVTNVGTNAIAAPGFTLTDVLPAGTVGHWVCGSSTGNNCSFNAVDNSTLSVTLPATPGPTLPAGAWAEFKFQGTLGSGNPTGTLPTNLAAGSYTNTATATFNGASMVDTDPSNNSASVTTPVQQTADLAAGKSLTTTSPVAAGSAATWTLSMTNNGPHTAPSATITDALPAGFTVTSLTSTYPGTTCTKATVACQVTDLAAGETMTATLVTTSSPGLPAATYTNSATTATNATDPTSTNNTATATVELARRADLAINVGDSAIVAGSAATFAVTITNAGPSNSSGTATVEIPGGVTFNAATTSNGCTATGQTVTCTFDTLTPADTTAFTIGITANATAAGPATITGAVTTETGVTGLVEGNNTDSATLTVNRSTDLQITKTLNTPNPVAGEPAEWTLTVTNNGPSEATGIVVNDPMPEYLSVKSIAPTAGTPGTCSTATDKSSFSCSAATLAAGASLSYKLFTDVSGTTPPGTPISNTATVESGSTDPNPNNNSATDSGTSRTDINLGFAKTVSDTTVKAGTETTFSISMTNLGSSNSGSLTISDPLPAGIVLSDQPNFTYSGTGIAGLTCTVPTTNNVECTHTGIPGNTTATVSFPVRVLATHAAGPVVNTATVNVAATGDNPAAQAQISTGFTVVREADLELTKTDLTAPQPAVAGQTMTWRLTATNHGPSTATSLVVTDALPDGMVYRSGPAGCTGDDSSVTCTAATLAVDNQVSFDVVVGFDAALAHDTELVNNASVSATEAEPAADSNTNTAAKSVTVKRRVDLGIAKVDSADPVRAGTPVTYQLTVTNAGPSNASAVVVTDTLPAGLTFAPDESTPACSANSQNPQIVTCSPSAPQLPPDGTVTFTVAATVDPQIEPGETLTNTTSVNQAETDSNAANNADDETTTIDSEATLTINKSLVTDPVVAGEPVTWMITVTNAGPSVARNVKVTDTLSNGQTLQSSSATPIPAGSVCTGTTTLTCDLDEVEVGTTTLTIVTNLPASATGTIANTAAVTTATPGNCIAASPANECADTTASAPIDNEALVTITKTRNGPLVAGNTVTWTVTIDNTGPSVARGVVVTDSLAAGLTYTESSVLLPGSANPSDGPCSGAPDLNCQLGDLAVGETTLEITTRVDAGATDPIDNTAAVTTTSPSNCQTAACTVSVAPASIDTNATLTIDKTVAGTIVAGQRATWNIAVANTGPSNAQAVTVTDTLPAGFGFVPYAADDPDSSATGCTATGQLVTCPLGTLSPSATTSTVKIVATAPPGATGDVTNAAAVSTSTAGNCDSPAENSCSDAVNSSVVMAAELGVSKSLVGAAVAGANAEWQLTVTNAGPSTARDITVTDQLDNNLTFVPHATGDTTGTSTPACTAAAQTVTCELATLAPGTHTFRVITTVNQAVTDGTPLANTAAVTTATTGNCTADGTPAAACQSTATATVGAQSQLKISKTLDTTPVVAGRPVSWTITITNTGPSLARGVTITDDGDDRLSNVTATTAGQTCNVAAGNQVTCDLGDVGTQTRTVTITGDLAANATGTLANTATVAATSNYACDPVGCAAAAASATITTTATLAINKTTVTDPVIAGEAVTWTATVTNTGPSVARATTLTDTLDPRLTLQSATVTPAPSGAACNGTTTLSCTLGDLAPNATATVTITSRLTSTATGTIANTARVTSSTPTNCTPQSDNDPCTSTATTPITQTADLTATIGEITATAGTTAGLPITVTNDGPSQTGARIQLTLPDAMVFVAAGSSGCTAAGQVVTCTLDQLARDATDELTVQVMVPADHDPARYPVSGVVEPTGSTTETDSTNNTAAGAIVVGASADLRIAKTLNDPLTAGQTAKWSITVTNVGPSQARSVTIQDEIPDELTVVAIDTSAAPNFTCDSTPITAGTTLQCTAQRLADETSETIVITTTVDPLVASLTRVDNTATVNSATPDPISGNNSATDSGTTATDIELRIAKSATPSTVTAGNSVVFTLEAINNGSSTATDVVLDDLLPALWTTTAANVSATVGTCQVTTDTATERTRVRCSTANLATNSQLRVTILAATDPAHATGSVINTATVTSSNNPQPAVIASGVSVVRNADLTLTKTVATATADRLVGAQLKWDMTVSNNGPSTATSVVVSDTLPVGATFVSGAGCSASDRVVTCQIATLNVDDDHVFSIVVDTTDDLADGTTLTNSATATADENDPTPAAASSTATLTRQADLTITKDDSIDPVRAGDPLSYQLVVTNTGPSQATSVVVTDTLPAGVGFDAAGSTAGCTLEGNVVTCRLDALAVALDAGESATVTIATRVDADLATDSGPTTLLNLARVSAAEPDPTSVATGESTDVVANANLVATKTLDTATVVAGAPLEYAITVTNTGPSVARTVSVVDQLDDRLTFIPYDPAATTTTSSNSCVAGNDAQSVTCTLGQLAPDATTTVYLRAVVAADASGTLSNGATVTTTTGGNCQTGCIIAAETAPIVRDATLTITKTGSEPVVAGSSVTWTVAVTNTGPSSADAVTITDQLDDRLTFVPHDPANAATTSSAGCTAAGDPVVVTCQPASTSLTPDTAATFEIVTRLAADATKSGPTISNRAQVTTTTPGQCQTAGACNATAGPLTITESAQLSIQKSVLTSPLVPGNAAGFLIEIINAGPSVARDVVISDVLDGRLTYDDAASTSRCAPGAGAGEVNCRLDSIPVGTTAVTVVAEIGPDARGTLSNTATVTASNSNCSPETACTDTVGPQPLEPDIDVSVNKVLTDPAAGPAIAGADLGWTITVVNNGRSTLLDAELSDLLDDRITPGAMAPTGIGTCAVTGQQIDCQLGEIGPDGDSASVTVAGTLAANAVGSVSNTATLTAPDLAALANCPQCVSTTTTTIASRAGLSLTKSTITNPVIAGNLVEYAVAVTNNGPSVARDVVVVDALDPRLTLIPDDGDNNSATLASTPGCGLTGGAVRCDLDTVAIGTETVTIVARLAADATGSLTNAATLTSETNNECTPGSDGDPCYAVTDTAPIFQVANLAVQVGTRTIIAGQTGTLPVTITNAGPSTVAATFSYPIPTGMTFNPGFSSSTCTTADGHITCTSAAIEAGGSAPLILGFDVPAGQPTGGYTNAGEVAAVGDVNDTAPANNTADGTITVTASADVQVTKTRTSAIVAGDQSTWTIVVTNRGDSDVHDVEVTDTFGAGLTFDSVSEDDPTVDCTAFPCQLSTLPAQQSVTFVVTATVASNVDDGTPVTNSAAANTTTNAVDPVPNNNSDSDSGTTTTSTDLQITKTANPISPLAGETITYTLTVTETGPSDADNVTIEDLLPAGFTVDSAAITATAGTTCQRSIDTDTGRHLVRCQTNTITGNGGQVVVTIPALIDPTQAAGTITNTATVAGDGQTTPATISTSNNIRREADLELTKTLVSTTPHVAGEPLEWTLKAVNHGPSTATAVAITDTLPIGTTFVSGPDCSSNGTTVTCDVPVLAPEADHTVNLVLATDPSIAAGTELTNTAIVTAAESDPTPADATKTTPPITLTRQADLKLTKTAAPQPVVAGQTLTYTLRVVNTGPSAASGVTVTDTLPANVTLAPGATPGCAADPVDANKIICRLSGELDATAAATFTLPVTVAATTAAATTLTNQAVVTATEADPDASDPAGTNHAEVSSTVTTRADLTVAKQLLTNPVIAGNTVKYQIVINNPGPSVARNIVATDVLDSRLTFSQTDSSDDCSATAQTVTCNTANLAVGGSVTFDVVATVDATAAVDGPQLANRVTVTTDTAGRCATGCQADAASVPVQTRANLTIIKQLATTPVVAGDDVIWNVTVANSGPSTARAVTISDTLQTGLTFIPFSAADPDNTSDQRCPPASTSVTCNVGDLAAGSNTVIQIVAKLDPARVDPITNSATVTTSTIGPCSNGCSATTDEAAVTAMATLDVTKTIVTNPPVAGRRVVFEVAIRNTGPSVARAVQLTDMLDPSLTFVPYQSSDQAGTSSATCALGSGGGGGGGGGGGSGSGSVICQAGAIGNDTTKTFRIVAQLSPDAQGILSNSATATTTTAGPCSSGCSDSAAAMISTDATLTVNKKLVTNPVVAGNDVRYDVTVTNTGPSVARAVGLIDQLDPRFTFVAHQPDDPNLSSSPACTVDADNTVTCPADPTDRVDLAVGATKVFQVVGTLDSTADTAIGNQATILTSTSGNCAAPAGCQTVTPDAAVTTTAGLSLTKTLNGPAVAGQPVTYQITVANSGPSAARGVSITDPLDTRLTFVASNGTTATSSASCTTATNAAGGVVTCDIGTLAAGSSRTVTIVADLAADAVAPLSNTATVTATTANGCTPGSPDDPCAATVRATSVDRRADLKLELGTAPTAAVAGTAAALTATVANAGPSTSTATVTVPIPRDANGKPVGVFVEATSTDGCEVAADGLSITCQLAALAPNANATLTLGVEVAAAATGSYTATGSVQPPTAVSDSNSSDNTSVATMAVSVSTDLQITKTLDQALIAGATSEWSITVTNNGPSDARTITISDDLPANLSLVSVVAGDPNPATGSTTAMCSDATDNTDRFDCSIATLTDGASIEVTLTTTTADDVGNATVISNTATVAAANDPNTSNNSATDSGTTATDVQLAIDKDVTPIVQFAGAEATFTITATNNGASQATNVSISDTLPDGLSFAAVNPVTVDSSGAACTVTIVNDPPSFKCSAPTLARNATITVKLTAQIETDQPAGPITNTATVNSDDADPAAIAATVTVTRQADLNLEKRVASTAPHRAGEQLEWELEVTNAGPSTATEVVIADLLPSGTSWAGPATCSLTDGVLRCPLAAPLDVGMSHTVTLVTNTDPALATGTELINRAEVLAAEPDPSSARATATATIARAADLSIDKRDDVDPATAGSALNYTLTVTNHGPSIATGTIVTDQLPTGLTFDANRSTPSCRADANNLVTCALAKPTLAPAESSLVQIATRIEPGVPLGTLLTNTGEITATEPEPDAASQPNSDSETTRVTGQANITLLQQLAGEAVAGQPVRWNIVATNTGPSVARHVVITYELADGLTFIPYDSTRPSSTSAAGCLAVGSTVTCQLGDMPASGTGSTVIVPIVAQLAADATGTITNKATLVTDTAGNCQTGCTATAAVTPIVRSASLTISKRLDGTRLVAGTRATFKVEIVNAGPSVARSVTMRDPLMAGLTFVGSTPTGSCRAVGQNVTCELGDLAPGKYLVAIEVAVDPAAVGKITNTVTVASATDPACLPSSPCVASSGTEPVVAQADVKLAKRAITNPLIAGGPAKWALTVTNRGPSVAHDVVVTDVFPNTVKPSADDLDPDCSVRDQVVSCQIAALSPGTRTITFGGQVAVGATDPVTNSAALQTPSTPNCTSRCFAATDPTPMANQAALSVTKTLLNQNVEAGGSIGWRVVVTNAGPSVAREVVLVDQVPASVGQLSVDDPTGWCRRDGNTVTCRAATFELGSRTIVITGVVAPGTVTAPINQATVTSPSDSTCETCVASAAPILIDPAAATTTTTTTTTRPIAASRPNGWLVQAGTSPWPIVVVATAALTLGWLLLLIRRRRHNT